MNPFHPNLALENILQNVLTLVRQVGNYMKQQSVQQNDIEFKGSHDYVTFVDKNCEAQLVKGLSEILPEAGFIAEEGTSSKKGERYNWIIDPLDGTTNFIHGVPAFCISIGLQDLTQPEDGIILGVIYQPCLDEMFYSHQGIPAYLNGKEIHVSTATSLENALLATGFPYYDYQHLDGYMDLLAYLMLHSAGIRRLGSAALDLAYVACGRFELFYEYGLRPWDVAAGLFLVKQAGGKVNDFHGGYNHLFGKEIIASNPHTHAEFSQILSRYIR